MRLRLLNPLVILAVLVFWIFFAPWAISLWDHWTQPVIEMIAERL